MPGGPGSQQALRVQNAATVLAVLRRHGPQVQASLARSTGLSNATVSNIVRHLVDQGRVRTERVLTGGRWSVLVSSAPDGRVVVGIDVGRTHLRVLGCDAAHRVFGLRHVELDPDHDPDETLALASRTLDEVLADRDVPRDRVRACGMALPASLSPTTGVVVQASVLPHWSGRDLAALATAVLGLPTVVDNDANLGALGHVVFGSQGAVGALLYLKVASGIGAGMAFDGHLYRSTSGLAGEIGHAQVVEGGDVCYCGNRGCLETVSSTRRVVADFGHIRPGRAVGLADVLAAARAGEPAIRRILEEAGSALGRVVAPVCNLLSPDVVVLGGPLTEVAGPLLDAMVVSVRQRALPSAVAGTRFLLSELDGQAEVHGACALALQHLPASGV
ncbi:MAG TPA: ROK family transcriptional regulator [Cellulomonas sp.]